MAIPPNILVTGASSGIGAALAEHLAAPGVRIALFARRRERLEELAQRVAAKGAEPLVLVGDVRDLESVQEAHGIIESKWRRVEAAFLNAGKGGIVSVTQFDAAEVRNIFEVNVLGIAHWLQCLLPPMLAARRGTLVGISSLGALRGLPGGGGAYSASKAAVTNLMESVRVEARPHGIAVCTVEPGFVKTEMTAPNKFKMPFLMEPADAARVICEGVARGKAVIRFPWPVAAAMALVRWMPNGIYDRIAGGAAAEAEKEP
jgi:short-subunit dehydrogenase